MEHLAEDVTDEDTDRIFFPFIDEPSEPTRQATAARSGADDSVGNAVLIEPEPPRSPVRRRRPSKRRRRVARRSLTGLGLADASS